VSGRFCFIEKSECESAADHIDLWKYAHAGLGYAMINIGYHAYIRREIFDAKLQY